MQYQTDVKYAKHQAATSHWSAPRATRVDFRYVSASGIAVHVRGRAPVMVTVARAREVLAPQVFASIPSDGLQVTLGLTGDELRGFAEVREGQEVLDRLVKGGRVELFSL